MRAGIGVVCAVTFAATTFACAGDDDDAAPSPETTPAVTACDPQTATITTDASGGLVTATLPGEPGALTAAIATSFCSPDWTISFPDGTTQRFPLRPRLTGDEATCIGDGLVGHLGPDRAQALSSLGAGPWSLLSFGLTNNGPGSQQQVDRKEAKLIVDTFVACTQSWELLLILSVTSGAEKISDAYARCVGDRLADDDARRILVGEVDRAYDDPAQPDAQPFPELAAPLLDAFDACWTAAEPTLDWD